MNLSVIVPCSMAHRKYLDAAIRSVQFQNYEGKYEIGIMTDLENEGTPAMLNQGISQAKGEYITVVHGDDMVEPWHLELLMSQAAPDRFVYGDLRIYSRGHKGGVLTMVRPEVELTVTAGDIPEKIVISLAGLEIGDTVTISSVDLPAGSVPTIDRDFVIANIQAPSGLASQSDDEEEGEEAAADEVPASEQSEDE